MSDDYLNSNCLPKTSRNWGMKDNGKRARASSVYKDKRRGIVQENNSEIQVENE